MSETADGTWAGREGIAEQVGDGGPRQVPSEDETMADVEREGEVSGASEETDPGPDSG